VDSTILVLHSSNHLRYVDGILVLWISLFRLCCIRITRLFIL